MNGREQELTSALRKLAAENSAIGTPADIEQKVLAAFDAHQRPARRIRWIPAVTAATVSAASGVIATLWLLHRPAPLPPRVEAPFIAIPYVAPPAPYERTEVKRMDVPLAALVAAGLDVHVNDVGASVRADVLIGQDGRALAIRLVRNAI